MTDNDIQSVIDSIKQNHFSEPELINLLKDDRALVRANVLMALPRRSMTNPQRIVDAIAAASEAANSQVKLMGTTTQRKLAIATLAWLGVDAARETFDRVIDTLSAGEREEIAELVRRGPITSAN